VRTDKIRLGEICDFLYGDGLKEANRRKGKVPVYGSNGIVGYHNQAITNGPTIIIGRKGSIGEVNWSSEPCYPIDTTYYVDRTKKPCHLRWLYFALLELDLTRFNKSAAVPGLNREDAYEQVIPFPELPEQRRIAAQLGQADRLRRTRRYALELSDSFLPAAFLEMFSGRGNNFPASTVKELAAQKPHAIRTGPFGSQLLHSEFTSSGIAVLGIDNAVNNRFTWDERRFITEDKYKQLKRYTVKPGDVLITIMGTCGRCAIVPDDIPTAINTKHLCCITLDKQRCIPIYLHGAFLYHPSILQQLRIATKGAIMEGLNMEIIKDLQIPLPSVSLQEKFASIMERHERLRSIQRESLRQADHLFQSLLHEAFSPVID
jgi:type I restriction enzyme S subunit